MTDRLRSPRKSILSRPRSSTPCISYWVTIGASSGFPPASGLRWMGRYSVSGIPRDHHRGGMDAVLAAQALEPEGDVDDLLGLRVGLVHGPHLARGGEAVLVTLDLVEAGPQRGVAAHDERWHGLGDTIAHHVGLAEHAGGISDGGSRLDRREGDDLRHPVAAVFLRGIPHDVGAVALVEVHVDVGHLLAARVQEALEKEVVADGVEVDDAQAVGHAAPGGRTTAGPTRMPVSRAKRIRSHTTRK